MKKIGSIFAVSLIFCMSLPLHAGAVSWPPGQEQREEKAAKGIKAIGDMVCLFQSGTEDIRKEIQINDILIVFRESFSHQLMQVGKVKIIAFVRDNYLKTEVIEGELIAGDIAMKGHIASLLVSSSELCK